MSQTILKREKVSDVEGISRLNQNFSDLQKEIAKVIVGQDEIIRQIFVAILSRGHSLLIGVPGLAKTLIVRTLAEALDLKFSRIQFTPDLMPSDITGTEIIEENVTTGERTFRFVKGPLFGNIILADEINRTPPKTQSALLEAMQEYRVTAAGQTFQLEPPFFVLATQNPIEQEGTYPLPEAQLDRFMFNLWLDYPSSDEEVKIVQTTTGEYAPVVRKVIDRSDILFFQELLRRVPVSESVVKFAVELSSRTRPHNGTAPDFIKQFVSYGAGPRASQYLILAAKAIAALENRFSPDVDDVKGVALPVLRHRVITNFNAEAENVATPDIIRRLLEA
ncbi:MAG TPA: MoxR family ATPase [Candidatus Acidoferrales bacterium]|nr:MoxR family ATPase [Candidatus Acidoferrales bacterium]